MVVTHKMTCNNGVYRCDDVDITVEEWSRALYSIPNNTFKYLMMLFYMPNHECTCNAAGEKYGVHSSSFIAPVTSIAKKAMDIASRFDVVAYDNKKILDSADAGRLFNQEWLCMEDARRVG